MFIDASALTAMMTDEEEARLFATRMQVSPARMTSPLSASRTAIDVAAILNLSIAGADEAVRQFLQIMNIQLLAIPPRASSLATQAFERFGGARHPANLSLDDCMAYACARYYRQPLLFKGEGFSRTDIETA